ncbi:hypothetical protein E4K72_01985 [Oxalobacteraceae bacterium OM1]|nr:hypothetical protein E4K72_01985 [Oxalobacteraceae bacterium OM1]
MNRFLFAIAAAAVSASAFAKLPPPSDEAKAAADLAKQKAAWGDKVAAYKLCQAQDKLAAQYLKEKGAKKPAVETPPCTDPGPFVAAQPAAPAAPAAAAAPAPAPQSAQASAPVKK